VILVIRFIGVLNAAIWVGAAVFLTCAAAPAFFSSEAKVLQATGMHPFYAGAMAQLVLARYFYVQYICGAIAFSHLFAEWVYLGRALQRFTLTVLMGLLCLGFAGGLWLQPKLHRLNLTRYGMGKALVSTNTVPTGASTATNDVSRAYERLAIPPAERAVADKSFKFWHKVSMILNVFSLGGLVFYFWRVTHPPDNLRFVARPTQFRS
jgi:Domain of unknown function (DUF4149)